jgi:hypothetical protein
MKAVSPMAVIILASAAAFGQGAAGQASGIDITAAWFNVYQGSDSNAAIPLVAPKAQWLSIPAWKVVGQSDCGHPEADRRQAHPVHREHQLPSRSYRRECEGPGRGVRPKRGGLVFFFRGRFGRQDPVSLDRSLVRRARKL